MVSIMLEKTFKNIILKKYTLKKVFDVIVGVLLLNKDVLSGR